MGCVVLLDGFCVQLWARAYPFVTCFPESTRLPRLLYIEGGAQGPAENNQHPTDVAPPHQGSLSCLLNMKAKVCLLWAHAISSAALGFRIGNHFKGCFFDLAWNYLFFQHSVVFQLRYQNASVFGGLTIIIWSGEGFHNGEWGMAIPRECLGGCRKASPWGEKVWKLLLPQNTSRLHLGDPHLSRHVKDPGLFPHQTFWCWLSKIGPRHQYFLHTPGIQIRQSVLKEFISNGADLHIHWTPFKPTVGIPKSVMSDGL